jgi:hypothetical protein
MRVASSSALASRTPVRLRAILFGALAAFAVAGGAAAQDAGAAAAPGGDANSDCLKIGKSLQVRAGLVTQAQKLGKKSKPDVFCSVYTRIFANGTSLIPELERNAAWCHVPDNVISAIKSQHAQVTKAKGQACQAAAQFRKMEQQARQNAPREQAPWGGTGDVLGGPLRVPPGAL